MLYTVNFYGNFFACTIKIQYIITYNFLSYKFMRMITQKTYHKWFSSFVALFRKFRARQINSLLYFIIHLVILFGSTYTVLFLT